MKQSEVLKVLEAELGLSNLEEINKALKAKGFVTKFRMTGPGFVHYGFTGLIKSLTLDGVKIYNVNKVNLIRYEDIKTFAKAVPREDRKVSPKPATKLPGPVQNKKPSQKLKDDEEEDYDNDDDFDEELDQADDVIENDSFREELILPKKKSKKASLYVPGSGSRFIPKKKS